MSFNSTQFVFFFLFVFFVYWAIARTRWLRFAFLFAASCVFYMSWNAKFFFLIAVSAMLDFYVGRAIHRSQSPRARKLLLWVSITGNIGMLGFFKYFNFFAENVVASLQAVGLAGPAEFVPWNIVLPVGISFYTFQTLSYTIDIYRRQLEPTDSLLKFALFVWFFPQLVAGPIVRARDFLPQLEHPTVLDDGKAARGVYLILLGLVKKVLLADTIAVQLVDPVFADVHSYAAPQIALAIYGALFQFYLDFSAYSDIAIGCAATLGFTLPLNFDRPFLAQSISEFWRRWHITLSTWLRDYLYFTLGGRGARRLEWFKNVMITMVISGLWHGAGWNYVIWGAMHGVFTFLGGLFRKTSKDAVLARPMWSRAAHRFWVFHLVAFSMLFFRNGTHLEGNRGLEGSADMLARLLEWGPGRESLAWGGIAALAVAALIHFTPKQWVFRSEDAWVRVPAFAQAAVLVFATGTLAALSYAKAPFVYFQF